MDQTFHATLSDYILSGHALLHAHTPEKGRFIAELKDIAATLPPKGRPLFVWSSATGWQDGDGRPAKTTLGAELGPPNPQTAVQQILELPEEAVFVLKDFGCYLHPRTFAYFDLVVAWLGEIRDVLAHSGRTVIFVGVDFEIPPALEHDITTITFKLPDDAAIKTAVRFVGEGHPIEETSMPAFDLDELARQGEGYTGADIREVVQLGLKLAFHAGAELSMDHLLAALPEIRPLSKTDPEAVTEVTHWLDTHTKPAGGGHPSALPLNGRSRKRRVTV